MHSLGTHLYPAPEQQTDHILQYRFQALLAASMASRQTFQAVCVASARVLFIWTIRVLSTVFWREGWKTNSFICSQTYEPSEYFQPSSEEKGERQTVLSAVKHMNHQSTFNHLLKRRVKDKQFYLQSNITVHLDRIYQKYVQTNTLGFHSSSNFQFFYAQHGQSHVP